MRYLTPHILLLLLCIISRLLTGIWYVEDPDSLSFALSVLDYDLANYQPHFPGYPVFSFIVKLLYLVTGSFSVGFSIVGGIAVYLIIQYSLKLLRIPLLSLEGLLVAFFIFFNPIIWLMSNRFMPDLLGTGVALASFYYLLVPAPGKKNLITGGFFAGLLAGIRLSYLPLLIIPLLYRMVKGKPVAVILSGLAGIVLWFIPLLIDTGFNDLLGAGLEQSRGHFNDFGSTVYTEPDMWFRVSHTFRSFWADSFACYWPGKGAEAVILSAGLLVSGIAGIYVLFTFGFSREKLLIAAAGLTLYFIWIFFFQNIVHHPRHGLPLVPFLSMAVAYGFIFFIVNFDNLTIKIISLILMLIVAASTLKLAIEHKEPTAASKVKDFVIHNTSSGRTIISTQLMNYYLKQQKVEGTYLTFEELGAEDPAGEIVVIGRPETQIFSAKEEIYSREFHHSPYVNRTWPDLKVTVYK